jgi:hypothetical protein
MRIVWDEPKRLRNIKKHGFDFAKLESEFFAASSISPARLGRWVAVGEFHDQIVSVVFAVLGTEAVAIISMRHASKKERRAQ